MSIFGSLTTDAEDETPTLDPEIERMKCTAGTDAYCIE